MRTQSIDTAPEIGAWMAGPGCICCGNESCMVLHVFIEIIGQPLHFVGRLGTIPARSDLADLRSKQRAESGHQEKTRDNPHEGGTSRDDPVPEGAQDVERLAQPIDEQTEIRS